MTKTVQREVFREEWNNRTKVLTIRAGKLVFKTFNGRPRSKLVQIHVGDAWRWRARAKNGRIVATSGESYFKRGNAEKAMRDFVLAVLGAR